MINPDQSFTQARGEAITRLDRLCKLLRFYSILIISTTFFNTFISLAILSWGVRLLDAFNSTPIIISIFLAFCAMIFALMFDYLRKEGDAHFEELSDELHGAKILNKEEIKNSLTSDEEFSLRSRIIMRNYSNSSSLPLIPGRYGPALIVGINFILSFFPIFNLPH